MNHNTILYKYWDTIEPDKISHTDSEEKIDLYNIFCNEIINTLYLSVEITESYKLNEKIIENSKNEMKKFIESVFIIAKKEFYEIGFILLFFQKLVCNNKNNNIKVIISECTGRNIINFKTYNTEFKIFFLLCSLLMGKYHDDNSMMNADYVSIGRQLNLRYFNLNMINQYEINLLRKLDYYIYNNFIEFEKMCLFYLQGNLIK